MGAPNVLGHDDCARLASSLQFDLGSIHRFLDFWWFVLLASQKIKESIDIYTRLLQNMG